MTNNSFSVLYICKCEYCIQIKLEKPFLKGIKEDFAAQMRKEWLLLQRKRRQRVEFFTEDAETSKIPIPNDFTHMYPL